MPYSTYGLDILAFIGWRHEHDQRQLVEIQRELQQRGILINERTVGKLYRQFLALLGGLASYHQQRLEAAVVHHGGLVWAIDALQPDGNDPPLYVLYEVLSHTPISAIHVTNPSTEYILAWLEPYTRLPFTVLATLSDGEKAVVAALTRGWSACPHQRCQLHFLNNLAKPAMELDARLRQHVRDELGVLAAIPDRTPSSTPPPQADGASHPFSISRAILA